MSTTLSPDQIERYRSDGILWPFRAIPASEAARLRAEIDHFERQEGFSAGALHLKGHLCFTWSHALAASPTILDVVEGVIGLAVAGALWLRMSLGRLIGGAKEPNGVLDGRRNVRVVTGEGTRDSV